MGAASRESGLGAQVVAPSAAQIATKAATGSRAGELALGRTVKAREALGSRRGFGGVPHRERGHAQRPEPLGEPGAHLVEGDASLGDAEPEGALLVGVHRQLQADGAGVVPGEEIGEDCAGVAEASPGFAEDVEERCRLVASRAFRQGSGDGASVGRNVVREELASLLEAALHEELVEGRLPPVAPGEEGVGPEDVTERRDHA